MCMSSEDFGPLELEVKRHFSVWLEKIALLDFLSEIYYT